MKSIIIHDWMLRNPNLKGFKLLIFATIYHFTSLGSGCFMSLRSWLDLLGCSKSQFFKARNDLIFHGLISFDPRLNVYFSCDISVVSSVSISTNSSLKITNPDEKIFCGTETSIADDDWNKTWNELMIALCPEHSGKSDNETGKSDNETGKSDNETDDFNIYDPIY